MTERSEHEEVRRQLRTAIETAMREAIERSSGSRVAALRRTRDQLLRFLQQPEHDANVGDAEIWRRMVAAEVEAFFQNYLQQLAGRR
jgi:hypothetical protein